MKRFIFLTFGFMGWAFYEMSGGAEFEPAGQRFAGIQGSENTVVAEAPGEASKIVTAAAENAARELRQREQRAEHEKVFAANAKASDSRDVTRVALNLTTLSDLPRTNELAMVEKAVAQPAVVQTSESRSTTSTGAKFVKASAAVPQNAGYTISSTNTPAIIPSLIDPNDTGVVNTSTQASTSQYEIRTVNGNSVNVRRGPGTNFGIVGKLGAGDAVKVIEDNGAGWVRLRAVDGSEMGWMAEFLLSAG